MAGRIFITGDKHGTFLPFFNLEKKMDLYASDVLIIAGDAGYVWNEDYPYAVETLEQLFPGVIAFVDGNHENHAILNKMEVKEWMGGKVHRVGERTLHLMRGEIYSIYENNIFVCGGARSNDKDRRVEGVSWWREEEPSPYEISNASKKIKENYEVIDYIITHETPLLARPFISRSKPIEEDYYLPILFEKWYATVVSTERFKKWFFGHMHVDQQITPQLRAIHNDIVLIDGDEKIRWT